MFSLALAPEFFSSENLTMLGMTGAGIAMGGVIGGSRMWLRWQRSNARMRPVSSNTVEASQSYRRYVAAAAWSGGSRRSWNHGVRPVLADLVDATFADSYGADATAAARAHLGEDLWSLVDRHADRALNDSTSAPSRLDLARIIRKLEEAT